MKRLMRLNNGKKWNKRSEGRGRRWNRKGMTLVEVIAAMAILAIVVVPTLRIFASASGTNLRSRMRQRATVVGEGVMESFKAYTVEQLCNQFQIQPSSGIPGFFKGVTSDSGNPAAMSVTATDAFGANTDVFDLNGKLNKAADEFHFEISNAASEGNYYDVKIEVKKKTAPDVLKMDNPNAYTNAIVTLKEDMNSDAAMQLEQKVRTKFAADFAGLHPGAASHNVDSVTLKNFKRTIHLDVADDGTSQQVVVTAKYTCEATVAYSYSAMVGGVLSGNTGTVVYDASDGIEYEYEFPGADPTAPTTLTVYDNSAVVAAAGKLSHIYLYYFPTYSGSFAYGDGAADVIELGGTAAGQLQVTIAKQRATSMSDTALAIADPWYDVTVTGAGNMKLQTNLYEKFTADPLAPGTAPSISGFGEANSIGDAMVDEVTLLYDVEVHVYEASTSNEVATYIGTKNE